MLLNNLKCFSDYTAVMKPDYWDNGCPCYSVTDDETGNAIFVDKIEMDAVLIGPDLVTLERFEQKMKARITEMYRIGAKRKKILVFLRSD